MGSQQRDSTWITLEKVLVQVLAYGGRGAISIFPANWDKNVAYLEIISLISKKTLHLVVFIIHALPQIGSSQMNKKYIIYKNNVRGARNPVSH